MFRFQISRMFRCREFRAALLLSSLLVCALFLEEVCNPRRLYTNYLYADKSALLDASEHAVVYGMNNVCSRFAAAWPFLVVLPFATSFIQEKKDSCIGSIVSRGSYRSYLRAKVIVSGIGSALVVFIPLLLNLLTCYMVLPSVHNLKGFTYYGTTSGAFLLTEGRMYTSIVDTYFLLSLYLKSPFLYELMYVGIWTAFSGLCGAAVAALSFRFHYARIVLFLPIYALVTASMQLRAIYFNKAMADSSVRYFDTYLCNYFVALGSSECYIPYFLIVCVLLAGLTFLLYRWANKNTVRFCQG